MLAAVAAIEDTAHVQNVEGLHRAMAQLADEEITKLGLKVDAERGEFCADPFPGNQGARLRQKADTYLTKRGLVLRALNNYGLSNELRMTIGTRRGQSPRRRWLARLHGGQVSTEPLFKRIALIGFGLIGGSIARAARAQGLAAKSSHRALGENPRAGAGIGRRRCRAGNQRRSGQGRRPRHPLHSRRRLRAGRRGIAPFLEPGAIVSTSARSREPSPATWDRFPPGVHFVPAHPVAGTEHSGPDSGFPELFITRWCILDPAGWDRCRGDRKNCACSGPGLAPGSRS